MVNNSQVKICCVIPARGGSKGIVDKNLKLVGGTSLVERAAKAATSAGFDAVFVYSDSGEIRQAGERGGATGVDRPANASGDSTTTEETIKRFLDDNDKDCVYRAVAVVQCTTPFLRGGDIRECLELFKSKKVDSVLTVCRCNRYLGYANAKNGLWTPMYPYRWLRQEYDPPFYFENGGVYLARRKWWEKGRRRGDRCAFVEMDSWRSLEIDDELELTVAESIADQMDGDDVC